MDVSASRRWIVVALLSAACASAAIGQARSRPQAPDQDQVVSPGEAELQSAIALTRSGQFQQAIPHFLALEGRVADEYARKFNLSLCYVATGEYAKAIPLLQTLRGIRESANVENLLTQAYIGSGQSDAAYASLQQAAKLTPKDEKLYLYVADACNASADYALGAKAMDLGLKDLPDSAELHYERGVFLALLNEFDDANREFDIAAKLAPNRAIGYVAQAHKALFAGNIREAVQVAREAVRNHRADYLLLMFLGDALIRSGAVPGQAEFDEARQALEKSVSERGNYADSRIALAKLWLLENRADDALSNLQVARQLDPRNAAVYSNLAMAYRRKRDFSDEQAALAVLKQINQEQAARIGSAPGDRKAGYAQHEQ